jgi:AraC-like DNA-binding protein
MLPRSIGIDILVAKGRNPMQVDESSLPMPQVSSVAGYRGPPLHHGEPHAAPQHGLACHLRAGGVIRIGGEEIRDPPRPILLLIARGDQWTSDQRGEVDCTWCMFDAAGITPRPGGRVRVELGGLRVERSRWRELTAAEARAAIDLLRELRRHAGSPDAPGRLAGGARLLDLLALWARSTGGGEDVVERYRALIERHACDERVALEELARRLDRDLDHLGARFRREHGMSPIEYRTRARLLRGREALADGSTVAVAARAAGFADQRYFARLFRRRYGATPSDFARSLPR